MLVLADVDQAAVGRDDVSGDEVVAGQAVLPGQPAVTAAQREASDARGGDPATRRGPAAELGLPVVLAPQDATLRQRRAPCRVDIHTLQRGQVDQQAALGGRRAGDAVSAAPDGEGQPCLAGVVDRVHDVRGAGGSDDQGRTPVDRAVVDRADGVVVGVSGSDGASPELRAEAEAVEVGRVAHGAGPFCGSAPATSPLHTRRTDPVLHHKDEEPAPQANLTTHRASRIRSPTRSPAHSRQLPPARLRRSQVSTTVSGLSDIDSMPWSISHSARSGWSEGP